MYSLSLGLEMLELVHLSSAECSVSCILFEISLRDYSFNSGCVYAILFSVSVELNFSLQFVIISQLVF